MKKQSVPQHYSCVECSMPLLEQVHVIENLYFCWECFDAKKRRARLLAAEIEFDESPDESIE